MIRCRQPNSSLIVFLILALVTPNSMGCRRTGRERASVRGKVTLDGEPVAEGSIRLVALESGPTAGAPISDGHYHIRRDKGPTLGRHRVEIYVPQKSGRQIVSPMSAQRKPRTSARGVTEDFANQSAEDESQEPNLNPMQAPPMVDEWVEAAPARYNTESMLELDVQSGRNAFDVEMTSQ